MRRRQHLIASQHVRAWALPIFIAVLLLCFGLIAQEVVEGEPIAFDRWVMLAFRHASDPSLPVGPPWLPEAVRDVTALGSTVVLGIVLLFVTGYLFAAGKRHTGWFVLATVLSGTALNSLLKLAFARPRPDLVTPLTQALTLSFPSGHAALSAICYLTLGTLLAQTQASRAIRVYFIVTAMLLTLLVGVSRIYLGVHYPTDVLAGWCIGIAWALICGTARGRLKDIGPCALARRRKRARRHPRGHDAQPVPRRREAPIRIHLFPLYAARRSGQVSSHPLARMRLS
jgi:undecaprenyl-diphosphatase